MKAHVVGDEALYRRFRQMSDAARGKNLLTALKAGGLPIQNEAKRLCPKLTGNLSRSIHIGGYGNESELSLSDGTDIGGNVAGRDYAEIRVGTNVEYAKHMEFGTSRMPGGKPYLRPAFDTQKKEATREFERAFRKLLTQRPGL